MEGSLTAVRRNHLDNHLVPVANSTKTSKLLHARQSKAKKPAKRNGKTKSNKKSQQRSAAGKNKKEKKQNKKNVQKTNHHLHQIESAGPIQTVLCQIISFINKILHLNLLR